MPPLTQSELTSSDVKNSSESNVTQGDSSHKEKAKSYKYDTAPFPVRMFSVYLHYMCIISIARRSGAAAMTSLMQCSENINKNFVSEFIN